MDLQVASAVLETLRADAQRAAPNEACGLLLGRGTRIDAAQPVHNLAPTPRTRFEIDPAALIAAHKAARGGGPELVGYFHSHPHGPAIPSATDRARAPGDGRVWAIVSAAEVRFWRDAPGGFEELSYAPIAR